MPTPEAESASPCSMRNSFVRNREGKIIARVDGNTLRDGTGKIVAVYRETENVTRNGTGRIVGKGNQSLRVLGEKERREFPPK